MDDWLLVLLEEIQNFFEALFVAIMNKTVSPNKEAQRETIRTIAFILTFCIVALIIFIIKKLRR